MDNTTTTSKALHSCYRAITDTITDAIDQTDRLIESDRADAPNPDAAVKDTYLSGYLLGYRHALDRCYDAVATQERWLNTDTLAYPRIL